MWEKYDWWEGSFLTLKHPKKSEIPLENKSPPAHLLTCYWGYQGWVYRNNLCSTCKNGWHSGSPLRQTLSCILKQNFIRLLDFDESGKHFFFLSSAPLLRSRELFLFNRTLSQHTVHLYVQVQCVMGLYAIILWCGSDLWQCLIKLIIILSSHVTCKGTLLSDKKEIRSAFNDHFAAAGYLLENVRPGATSQMSLNEAVPPYPHLPSTLSLFCNPCPPLWLLKTINANKATGEDCLGPFFFHKSLFYHWLHYW